MVCAARGGDKQALAQLLQDNWSWLKGLTYNVLGNIADVDEALQDLCVLTLENIATLREPERFKGWLAAVARNAALARRRKRSCQPIQLDDLLAQQQLAGDKENALDKLVRQEHHQLLLDAISLLPEKYWGVFVLKYMNDLPYAQISEILDLPLTTVQIRLVRARRMLYNRLTGKTNHKVPRT